MNRATFALMKRSLILDSRSLWTYAIRVGLVLFVSLLVLIVREEARVAMGAPGLQLFRFVAGINYVFILLAGLSYFATAITEEKEDGTLGLMRMTRLSPMAIILGKSGARLLSALLLLLAQFPFTLLAITLGGISFHQILAVYLNLGAFLLLICGVGVLSSVVCSRTRSAAGLTFAVVLGLVALPTFKSLMKAGPGAGFLASTFAGGVRLITETFELFAPQNNLVLFLSSNYKGTLTPSTFYYDLGGFVLCFVLAWRLFESFNSAPTKDGPSRSVLLNLSQVMIHSGRRRVWPWAIVWKDFYFVAGGLPMMLVKSLMYFALMAIVLFSTYNDGMQVARVGPMLMLLYLFIMACEMSLLSGRFFKEEIQYNTWAGLYALPDPLYKVVGSKVLGCIFSLCPVFCFFAFAALFSGSSGRDVFADDILTYAFFCFCVVFLFFIHLIVYLSLVLRWGALPASIAITLMINIVHMMAAAFISNFSHDYIDEDTIWTACAVTATLGILLLHSLAWRKLRSLAAQ